MKRKRKKLHKALAAILAVFCLAGSVNADVLSDLEGQKSELQQQQQELEDRSKALNERLEQLKDDEARQQEYYNSLVEQIDVVETQIDTANERLSQLDSEIVQLQDELSDAQTQLDADFDTLKERLCALYKLGNAGTLEIILNAESLPDLAQKAELMAAITRHDTQLMDSIRSQMEEMASQKELLESDREEASTLRTTLEEKKDELTSLQDESARVLEELKENQQDVTQQIDDAEEQKEELIQQLAEIQKQWLAEKEKAEATPTPTPEATPAPQPNVPDSGGSSATPSPTIPPSSSGYIWPVPGFTKVGDGWYEGGRAHKGIDIIGAGIYGQPIVAAQSGVVLTAYTADEWGYGWGYHVMIGHDDGYATQYAHMSRVAVTTGQYVEQGQIIGYVGNTGDSYGAHLHFELWENGERINPEIVLPYR